jgi:chromosome condensin MukBEF ATPase and DNA-binding subunit MukB
MHWGLDENYRNPFDKFKEPGKVIYKTDRPVLSAFNSGKYMVVKRSKFNRLVQRLKDAEYTIELNKISCGDVVSGHKSLVAEMLRLQGVIKTLEKDIDVLQERVSENKYSPESTAFMTEDEIRGHVLRVGRCRRR